MGPCTVNARWPTVDSRVWRLREYYGNGSQCSGVPVGMERSVAGHLRRRKNIVRIFCWNVDVFGFCGVLTG